MVGLDDAGRTSILNRLHRRDLPKNALLQTLPTIGCTRETVQHRGNEITIWEFGGQEKIRPMWRSYLWQGHAFAFVLDASATDRVKEAKEELVILLKEREYTSFPFLVIANKVDKEGALGVDEIAEALDLKTVFEKHTEWPWTIMVCGSKLFGLKALIFGGRFCAQWQGDGRDDGLASKSSEAQTTNPTEIVMLSLDDSGATSILNRLHRPNLPKGILPKTIPTIGMNVETITHGRSKITIWEMGGNKKIRPLWRRYLWNGHAFAFVVDASAPERFAEARQELNWALKSREYTAFPFLVVVNKMDKEGAVEMWQVEEALDLKTLFAEHTEWPWGIMGVSAMTGQGLDQMLEWFTTNVSYAHIARHDAAKKNVAQAW
ncbi:hypothetical protein MIND_00370600 [Mycena indigotica]|uniref:ADP-ribosylation factor n=1 Tax=Mycena indigotica TaxID=2126181 RepID=A0A8H6WCQ3_9AGAR|nr:uncharacterized protein MIND_00370600 [Mycena indigotica]KAF7309978.1 hypothetical protein MIND_00370600 [Mycena indigotica]